MKSIPNLRSRRFVSDAYAFLNKQLELLDPKIMEPLSGTDWPRDMPVKTGGGFVENVAVIDVSYASTGAVTATSTSNTALTNCKFRNAVGNGCAEVVLTARNIQ